MVSFLRQSFLLGRHPPPGVGAKEVYVSWCCKYARTAALEQKCHCKGETRDAIFFPFRLIQNGQRQHPLILCRGKRKRSLPVGLWHVNRDGGGKERQNKCPGHLHAASQSRVVVVVDRQNTLQYPCTARTFLGHAGACGKKWPFPLFFPRLFSLKFPTVAHWQCHYE